MIGEILSLIPSIIGLFGSNKSHDQYSDELNRLNEQQRLSRSALQAKSLLAENATRGLVGLNTMRENVNNQLPTTLNESKDWLTSGGAVDFLSRASAATNKQLLALDMANESAKQDNMKMYAGYLGGAMANREDQLLDNKTQLGVASAYNMADKSATQNKYMFGMGNALAGISDKDLSDIIALLSGNGNSNPSHQNDNILPGQENVQRNIY